MSDNLPSRAAEEALDALKEALNPTLANRIGSEIRRERNERLADFTDEYAGIIRKALRVLEMVETLNLRDRVHYNAITGGQIAENATNQGWNDCLEIFKQIAEGKVND